MTIRTTKPATEATILKACCQWLDLNHYCYWRNFVGPVMRGGGKSKLVFSPNPMRGLPDLIGVLPNSGGRMWAAELKTPKGKLSPEQLAWQRRLKAAGVAYFVPRSLDELVGYLIDEELILRGFAASGGVSV